MGLLDDAASTISGRSSHTKHASHKHKHRSSTTKHGRSHSKSDSDTKSRKHRRSSPSSRSNLSFPGLTAGFWGGGEEKHKREKRDRSRSRTRSFFGLGDEDEYKKRSSRSGPSFFGLSGGNASTRSFFGFGDRHHGGSSYYKRSPRPNFMHRAVRRLKRLLRDLVYYAKRHPVKVFMLVVMPLITGGFLTALLARFGLRLPRGIERMLGMAGKAATGDSIGLVGEAVRMASGGFGGAGVQETKVSIDRGRSRGYEWERRHVEKDVWPESGESDWGISGLVSGVGKMFM